ncbi:MULTISPECIES: thiamine pyrophosphate-dependent dehydrogenase E1 component subunit alpha [Bacillus amyloliquefaciens group]|uniref:thiamine pyrophosphate-dependent dehydrogenase E1 component subunit alpha n=1 Tax=Bacillus amyloliquefaciens group TaxID=1938374 RepID=UPI0018EA97DA|nr:MULTISPECIES: thiamine pyrophosphate-dependent dehydrogenase E1 component subunit alpha [Bacillus amyloliquefaciens group]MCM3446905.1 thiamine pyrophosphate-dependent dehydrogenase E1 component subunit alpha [Bacillus velezensis]QPV76197.1 thiamine pyrophosphate-dependent dehydrogenase E1 component subunit alpha [Bacillus velezensis]UNE51692.1 thiamine pyrophosphate-dependent dehydrogenase E1 component subunit alpha [Bacillus amyloliquefaciens]
MTTNRHQALGLSDEEAVEMYRTMLLARKIDERMWLLNRSGKIPFVVSCQGQEAAQVGAAYALNRDTDYVLPYYRDIGVVLAFGMTAKDLMMSGFAKAADPNSGGRQMPGHFGQKENRIVTGSSPVTTQVPHAVGIALAGCMDKKDIVSFVTFGEGSSNQGDFHEGANFAAVYKLPVIFMCENNKYAISVPYDRQVACEKISDRAAGYGMPGVTVDGNDLLEVYRAVKEARERASKGEGPTLIETVSYRLTPHSSDDDDSSYREREEVEEAKKQDPLLLYKAYLQEAGLLGEEEEKTMLDDIMAIVNEATDEAEKAPYASPESTLDHVYAK